MDPSNRAENYKNLHSSVPNSDGKVIDAESEKISQVASQLRVNNDATFFITGRDDYGDNMVLLQVRHLSSPKTIDTSNEFANELKNFKLMLEKAINDLKNK